MNLAKALYYNEISPEKISQLILNIVKGFDDEGIRKLNFFDLFIIIPFYSYRLAQKKFERIKFNPVNSFQRDVERNPDIFSDLTFRYEKSIKHIKLGVLYAVSNGFIKIGENLEISANINFTKNNQVIFNTGKVFSTKSTADLYNFFEVDIYAI